MEKSKRKTAKNKEKTKEVEAPKEKAVKETKGTLLKMKNKKPIIEEEEESEEETIVEKVVEKKKKATKDQDKGSLFDVSFLVFKKQKEFSILKIIKLSINKI